MYVNCEAIFCEKALSVNPGWFSGEDFPPSKGSVNTAGLTALEAVGLICNNAD